MSGRKGARKAAGEGEAGSLAEVALCLEAAARMVRHHAAMPQTVAMPRPAADFRVTAQMVRSVIAARRLRDTYFPNMPGDAVFAMLLELYAARLEGRRVAQSRLAVRAGVPNASAVRITRALLDAGVFTAASDSADRRLILLTLSDDSAAQMKAYLTIAMAAVPVLL